MSCAQAQAEVDERIKDAFALVPGNSVDLAVPLTRRALARRSTSDPTAAAGSVAPLKLITKREGEGEASGRAKAAAAASDDVTAWLATFEEGSADPLQPARPPRPRPTAPDVAEQPAATGDPLDLVAGGEVPDIARPAASEPQDLLAPAPFVRVTAAPAEQLPVAPAAAQPSPAATAAVSPRQLPDNCLAPSSVTDGDDDFERNEAALAVPGICIAEQKFRERRRPWTIQTVTSSRPGPLWVVIHDDEQVAFDNAVAALSAYGGVLVALDTGGDRDQDGIDPNRNFSGGGIGCAKLSDAAPKFTAAFRKLYDPAHPIIALHNNSSKPVPTGRLGHVSMDAVPKGLTKRPASDADGPFAHPHTLVLLAATDPGAPAIADRAARLNAAGMNVILEPVGRETADCSLSNHVVLSGHENYFNVTVDHDAGEQQRRIVDTIMSSFFPVVARAEP
jgi:hypothetical protein